MLSRAPASLKISTRGLRSRVMQPHITTSMKRATGASSTEPSARKDSLVARASPSVAPLLAKIGPKGPLAAAGLLVLGSFIWLLFGIITLVKFISSPKRFLHKKDRSDLKLPEPEGLQHEMLEVNGIKIHAVSPGRKPEKPLMLFLHGFPESWYTWKHQLKEFGNDYDVVAVDMRGYGLSDKPEGVDNYILDKLATDVKGMVAALGHSKCNLVAHDWGGLVAWITAGMYPEILDRLIILACPHLGLYQALKSWYILYFQAPWLPELASLANDANFVDENYRTGSFMGFQKEVDFTQADIDWIKQALQRPGSFHAMLNYYRGLFRSITFGNPKVWDAMRAKIYTPTLLIWAGKDGAMDFDLNKNIEQVVESIQIHNFENNSHWLPHEEPQEVNKLIKNFMYKFSN